MLEPIPIDPSQSPDSPLEETAELFLGVKSELASFGISCERNSNPEVLGKIYRVIELLLSLVGDGFTIDVPAIVRQLTSELDAEDWNLLITEPKGGLYAKVFSDKHLLRENLFPMYNFTEQKLISELYDRVREEATDKIGECIGLLLDIKFDLHESNFHYSVDADKLADALSTAASVTRF